MASDIYSHRTIALAGFFVGMLLVLITAYSTISTRQDLQTLASIRQDEISNTITNLRKIRKLTCSNCLESYTRSRSVELCFDKNAKASYCNVRPDVYPNTVQSNIYTEGVTCVSCTFDLSPTPTPGCIPQPTAYCIPDGPCKIPAAPPGGYCTEPISITPAPSCIPIPTCMLPGANPQCLITLPVGGWFCPITTPSPTASRVTPTPAICAWCGSDCMDSSLLIGKTCITIAPPSGFSCGRGTTGLCQKIPLFTPSPAVPIR